MALEPEMFAAASAAEERLIEAEHKAAIARADFQRAVRRLHLSGGSLREIASEFGLSHQRVHQIVEDAGGGRHWRKRKDKGEPRACSFCGRPQRKSRQLVAGPGVFICESCVTLASGVLSTRRDAETPLSAVVAIGEDRGRERCSFCGKRRHHVAGLASTGDVEICSECLTLCDEILVERLA
jgi:hypothetical protein